MKLTNSNGVLTKEVTGWKKDDVQKNAPGKKRPLLRKLPPGELPSRSMVTGKFPPGNLRRPHLRKNSPHENCSPEKYPPKKLFF